ncbi:MAG TPA: heme ABC transporter permease CcmC [Hyphomicrobiaceae bacterium]|nr:heme ABC transporter permease CcmC [Hyphomicrobiaceae bacterium]
MTQQTFTQSLANPTRFMALSAALLPWITGAAGLVLAVGLVWAFGFTPPDYQHKETVKIMFVHVPAAWIGMGAYTLIAVSSVGLLVWRHPLADVSAKAAAPIGAAFTLVCLVTGSLWGMPGWGTYWEWDARLTSVLLLFFLYLGLIALRTSIEDESLASRLTAILGIVGVVLLPIIKFSVDWWWTLHQKASVMTLGEQKVHWSIRAPLLVMALGFLLAFIAMHLKAMQNEVLRRRIKAIRIARVAAETRRGASIDAASGRQPAE